MPEPLSILKTLGEDNEQTGRTQQFCGDIDMRISKDGTWHYAGTPIGRMALVKLFATILKRDEEGDYWLETPVEKARLKVEDAPFTVVAMEQFGDKDGKDCIRFQTNLDDDVILSADNPLWVEHGDTDRPRPYINVRDGLNALVTRSVYYEMVNIATIKDIQQETHLGLWSKGQFFSLGPINPTP